MSEYKLKANELRIGNLVSINGEAITIKSIEFNPASQEYYIRVSYPHNYIQLKVEALEPILLTEEWLLKMGFTKDGLFKNEYVFTLGKFFFSFNNHMIYLINGYEGDVLNYVGSEITDGDNYIKHIHQVQNVYYSLTNEELTIR